MSRSSVFLLIALVLGTSMAMGHNEALRSAKRTYNSLRRSAQSTLSSIDAHRMGLTEDQVELLLRKIGPGHNLDRRGDEGVISGPSMGGGTPSGNSTDPADSLEGQCLTSWLALGQLNCFPPEDSGEQIVAATACTGQCGTALDSFGETCGRVFGNDVNGELRFLVDLICLQDSEQNYCYDSFTSLPEVFGEDEDSVPTAAALDDFCAPCTSLVLQHVAAYVAETEEDGDETAKNLIQTFQLACLQDSVSNRWCIRHVALTSDFLDCPDQGPYELPSASCIESSFGQICGDRCYRKFFQALAPFQTVEERESINAILSFACQSDEQDRYCWPLYLRELTTLFDSCPGLRSDKPDCTQCLTEAATFVTNTGCCVGSIAEFTESIDPTDNGLREGLGLCQQTVPEECPSKDTRTPARRLLHVLLLRAWIQNNENRAAEAVRRDVASQAGLDQNGITVVVENVEGDRRRQQEVVDVVFEVDFRGFDVDDTDAAASDLDLLIRESRLALPQLSTEYGADNDGEAALINVQGTQEANNLTDSASTLAVAMGAVVACFVAVF